MTSRTASRKRAGAESRDHLMVTLYQRHARGLTKYLHARFGNSLVDPDDVIQSTFLRLAEHDDPHSITDHRAYIFAVACNIAIDSRRRKHRRKSLRRELELCITDEMISDISSDLILIDREKIQSLEFALMSMPELRRRVFLSVRLDGVSVKDLCADTGLSEAAVYKHVARAVIDCARALERYDSGYGKVRPEHRR